jgi:hypothetical protein
MEHHVIWTHTFLLHAVISASLKATRVFSEHLDEEEMINRSLRSTALFSAFMTDHFLPWAETCGLDTDAQRELISSFSQQYGKTEATESNVVENPPHRE